MTTGLLDGFPMEPPAPPSKPLRFADVAVTPLAPEFQGRYRGNTKQYHAPDFDCSLQRARKAHVEKILLTCMKPSDVASHLKFTKPSAEDGGRARPELYTTAGIHPYRAGEALERGEEWFEELGEMLRAGRADGGDGGVGEGEPESKTTTTTTNISSKQEQEHEQTKPQRTPFVAAVGELGLDFSPSGLTPTNSKSAQLEVFTRQLQLYVSLSLTLPLFLHCRDAFPDFISTVTPFLPHLPPAPRRGLVHSFVGNAAQMHELVALGFSISVNGFSFRDGDSLRMVRELPMERMMLETDAPWGELGARMEVVGRYCGGIGKWKVGVEGQGEGNEGEKMLGRAKKRDRWIEGEMVKERNESCMIARVACVVAGLKGIGVDEVVEVAWRNSVRMFGMGEE